MSSNLKLEDNEPELKQPSLKQSTSLPASSQPNDFKNSLAALLSRGNPMALGPQKKQPKVQDSIEEEPRNVLKMDIFNDGDDEEKPAGVIDNVSFKINNLWMQDAIISKPVMSQSKQKTTKYDFDQFDFDDE